MIHKLEKVVEYVPGISLESALIIDGMAFIQQVQNILYHIWSLADKLLHELVGMTKNYKAVGWILYVIAITHIA